MTFNCSKRHNFNVFQTALSDMNMQNQQEEFKDFQVLLYKFQDIQGLEFFFQIQGHSRTFKFCTNPIHTADICCRLYLETGTDRLKMFCTVVARKGGTCI